MSRIEALLGGKVLIDQGGAGLRATIEPVLLAASVAAEPGEVVLEAGAGVGTAALCLLARCPDVRVVGVEREADQAMAAEANAARNGWGARFVAIAGDIADRATARAAASLGPFQHAMANPPWFAAGTRPEDAARRVAKHAPDEGSVAPWVAFLARRIAPRGTLTLVLPPALLPEALTAFARSGLGAPLLFPLWPRQGEAAKRLILAGRKGARGGCRILPGLVLHWEDGRYTDAAESALRHGEAVTLA
ncbi:tRNA1(Val) (adenine(37)-N6)-methyltransferase [Elioraea rosea]|uniref:tRNA1(Val) (adenine(37)-N6)-methyltransferase n=1 Tax=Elioraea rosea TaxID=2492390 RepID=UPI001183E902|nr:methyltransferase [Elioraea rosea]